MGLFDRFEGLSRAVAGVEAHGTNPFGVRMDEVVSATEAVIAGRPTILAGTNNYLGLTFEPGCIEAAVQALDRFGTGTTGSRIANGSYDGHARLEQALAAYYGRKHAIVFTTGYQANLGIISTIAGPGDTLIIDADCHASIYDGCKLGQATVIRFKHNDPADLDKRLKRLANDKGNKVIIVEGIYSMLGDQAPLAEIAEVKARHGAYLLVDEAHSLGVLGAHGRGLLESSGVDAAVDFVTGTFSKSLGAIGGFCVSDHPQFDVLRVASRPYMFTASLPPSIVASVLSALEVMENRPELRAKLWANVETLYGGLQRQGFVLGPQKGPVVALHLPSPELAIATWQALLSSGVYVNLALPPATPNGACLLRCSVCAAHTRKQLETIIELITDIAYSNGALQPPARAAVG
jgi:8-amino-7-oxononanoate synthase